MRTWLMAAASALALAGCAGMNSGGNVLRIPMGEPILRPAIDALLLTRLDADADQNLTPAEAGASAGPLAARFDRDADQALSALELREFGRAVGGAPESAPLLALADKNGDGEAALTELSAYFAERVRQLDANADGAVDPSELMERIAPIRPPNLEGGGDRRIITGPAPGLRHDAPPPGVSR